MTKTNQKALIWKEFNQTFWPGYNGNDGDGPVTFMWFARIGTFNLMNNIVVEIELKTHGHRDHYVGYEVRLIHRINGLLTNHFFRFDDYFEERDDDRDDYPLDNNDCFYVDKNADWYVAKPTFDDIVTFQSEVMTFINEYGEVKPR